MQPPAILSPFSSPPPKENIKQKPRVPSHSDPELVPVLKKLDDTPGFENLIRDSQRGIKAKLSETKRAEQQRSLNGIETDPTLVSNLLKESLAKPVPITVQIEKKSPIIEKEVRKEPEPVVAPPAPVERPIEPLIPQPVPQIVNEESEHRHKKEKKKKEKHKHKDRDKSKEERKKHKKDKEREKKKEEAAAAAAAASPQVAVAPPVAEALKITIPREKLSVSPGLKIKIPKDRLAVPPPPPQGSGIKIKIPKEVLETSRKRVHGQEPGPPPPQKFPRQNGAPHPHKVQEAENGHK